jgi:SAM-dependent methyltransferase/uncharacterized protein YbaR (Trm112 family)
MWNELSGIWRCPGCHHPELRADEQGAGLTCPACAAEYPVSDGRPVLIRPGNPLFSADMYTGGVPAVKKKTLADSIIGALPRPSVTMNRRRLLAEFIGRLGPAEPARVLVLGCGRQRLWLEGVFAARPATRLVFTDVDPAALADMICDAHDIPFADESFDGVIATAVLEHVLYPEQAVGEIHRVLKNDAPVYSEIPFLQQVHEGAYDFTRFTLGGHRRLFLRFTEVESGMVAGPGTALVWSIESFGASLFRSRPLGQAARYALRLLFFWLKYFDYLFRNRPAAMDGASCTCFLGKKRPDAAAEGEIIRRYVGGFPS